MKGNMAESEVECFSWVKTTQNSKTEGGIEKKKHKNVKLKEENVPGAILPGEKLEECTVCYRSSTSNWRSEANVHILAGYVLPLVFYKMPDQGDSWSYLFTKAHNHLHISSQFKVPARLIPLNNPNNASALSLVPRLSLFSEVSYSHLLD